MILWECLIISSVPPQGLANLTALGNMITWQRAEYDFKFQKLEYDTDVPCLVLSEGRYTVYGFCQLCSVFIKS